MGDVRGRRLNVSFSARIHKSGITRVAMFWQKEFVKEAVRLQKALAVQPHGVSLDREEAPVLKRLERSGETLAYLDCKFVLEVTPAHVPQLELQNKLPNEPLIRSGRESSINGELPLLKTGQIRFEIVLVLI